MAPPKQPVKRREWRRAVFASELPSASRFVLLCLLEYANVESKAWPSISTIANDTGLSRSSVKRGIAAAAAAGWIEVVERHAADGRQSSNGYRIHGLDARVTQDHPRFHVNHPQSTQNPSPVHGEPLPGSQGTTKQEKEADKRSSSKQVSQVVRDTWGEVAPGVALPAAVLSGYAEAVQEAALREVATAVAAGRCANPAGLLVTVLRQAPEDASGATADEILGVLRPPAPKPEPIPQMYRPFVKVEEPPLTDEEKAGIEEAKRLIRAMFEEDMEASA